MKTYNIIKDMAELTRDHKCGVVKCFIEYSHAIYGVDGDHVTVLRMCKRHYKRLKRGKLNGKRENKDTKRKSKGSGKSD